MTETRDRQADQDLRYRAIFESAVDFAIIASDPDGLISDWNPGAERILGWTAEEMLGEPADRFFTPEDRGAGRPASEMKDALRRGRASDERWHLTKSGARFWASGEMMPLLDGDGAHLGFLKILRDRTASRLAGQLLSDSEARFRILAEAIPGFVWTADGAGMLTYTSPRWHEYSGSGPGQAEGEGWTVFIHPDDLARTEAAWATSVACGTLYETELRLRAADGSYRWWLGRAMPSRDESGAVAFWAGVCTDIEAIVAAREALDRSREDLELQIMERTADRNRLWQLSTDIMLVARLDGVVIAVNPAWTAILGWTEQEAVGRSLFDFVQEDDLDNSKASLRRLADGAAFCRFESRCRRRDGHHSWIAWTAVPGGGLLNAVGRDTTAEKEQAEALRAAEEQLRQSQKMEAVGQLTGGLAHDFNNLLTGIMGSLELLQTRVDQGRTKELDRYITAAQGAARRAAALTHRLLAFSRRQTLDPKPTNLNRLVAGMEELIRRTMGPAISVEMITAGGLWNTLVDSNQLENALLNLCLNARDAMPDGGKLTVETGNKWLDIRAARIRDLPPGQYVSLCVSDTGTGIHPDVMARVFDPFFTTKPVGLGTGLGLSMIYGFARQSGGQVRLYSEVGQGTMACIYLPRFLGDEAEADLGMQFAEAPRAERGETVLVVDDESSVRMLVAEVLQDLGYAAIETANAAAALKAVDSGARIDLLVTDVGLPGGMNGPQLAEAARQKRPGLKVLFITGYAENAVVSHGHLEPGLQVMTKPFAIEALASRIKQLIAGS